MPILLNDELHPFGAWRQLTHQLSAPIKGIEEPATLEFALNKRQPLATALFWSMP
jgi:hypothetical protein